MKLPKCLSLFFMCIVFLLPVGWAEESGIEDWGVNDAVYGLKTRENEEGFSYTPSPADWRDRNIYQLFTDRFAWDGIDRLQTYNPTWKCDGIAYPANRNFHHGGSWKGLQQQLDYLQGMGITALWISGVQQNDQGKDTRYTPYHQYHVNNFFKCDPAMGTFQDLRELIDECHRRGMAVILDVAPNHMCDKNGLRNGEDDKGYWASGGPNFGWWNDNNKHPAPFDNLDYFHNNGTINKWDQEPEKFLGQFKGTDDLKTEHADVSTILLKAFKNLIDATDCDGFRVDAIKHVPYDWCRKWAQDLRDHAAYRGKNDFLMFGELFSYNHGELASWCKDGYGFNSALLFPMMQAMNNVFGHGYSSYQLGEEMGHIAQYGQGASRAIAFLDNHDVNRFALTYGGNDPETAKRIMAPAMSFLYLAPPVPLLFYGTEHMFNQGKHSNGSNTSAENPDDGDWQRECMFDKGFQPGNASGDMFSDWAKNRGLYYHIAWLNDLRNKSRALRRGGFEQRQASGGQGIYAFTKWYDQEVALVIVNTSDSSQTLGTIHTGKGGETFYENGDATGASFQSDGNGNIHFGGTQIDGKGTKIYICNFVDNSSDLGGGATADLWARNTYGWPTETATTADIIYVNTEAGPAASVAKVEMIYGFNNPTGEWPKVEMSVNPEWESNGGQWYNYSLGNLSTGLLAFCICVTDTEGNEFWDNNGGGNYTMTISPALATDAIRFAGVSSSPTEPEPNGSVTITTYIEADADVADLTCEIGYAVNPLPGAEWPVYAMEYITAVTNEGTDGPVVRTGFEYVIESLPAGAVVRYYLAASPDGGDTMVYANNNGQDYTIQVKAWPPLPDGVVITDPAEPYSDASGTNYNVSGTAGANLMGDLYWTNALNQASGRHPLDAVWSVFVPLSEGTNEITVSAQIGSLSTVTNAQDSSAGYPEGDFNGLNQGVGFGAWAVTKAVEGAEDKSWAWANEIGFGLATSWGYSTKAVRPLPRAMEVGDTFSVFFKNGDVAFPADGVNPGIGFGLCNTANTEDNIWGLWFNGGDTFYSTTGAATEFGWTPDGIQIDFTLTSTNTYSVDLTPTGGDKMTLTGNIEGSIDCFRFWNWSSKQNEGDYDVYVNQPMLCTTAETEDGTSTATVWIVVGNAPVHMVLDDPELPSFFSESGFTFLAPDGYEVASVLYATNLLSSGHWDMRHEAAASLNSNGTITVQYPAGVSNAILGVYFQRPAR
ncbi:MAG: hypothetical protein LBN38_00080 [Verrucomicrobiota bacterium]|jgi:glycosidase|nr:hypothetical protein [Verrucomicrobiota bacterium]